MPKCLSPADRGSFDILPLDTDKFFGQCQMSKKRNTLTEGTKPNATNPAKM